MRSLGRQRGGTLFKETPSSLRQPVEPDNPLQFVINTCVYRGSLFSSASALRCLRGQHSHEAQRRCGVAKLSLRSEPHNEQRPLAVSEQRCVFRCGTYQIIGDRPSAEQGTTFPGEALLLSGSTDTVFVCEGKGAVGLADCGHVFYATERGVVRAAFAPIKDTRDVELAHMYTAQYHVRNILDGFIEQVLFSESEQDTARGRNWQPRFELLSCLRDAVTHMRPPEAVRSVSVLAACLANNGNLLYAVRTGNIGFLVIRDQTIVFSSLNGIEGNPETQRTSITIETCTGDVVPIYLDVFRLRAYDTVIFGTDGLFDNISESQILALVCPVSSAYDSNLAVANRTCLGTFTHIDPVLLSYQLAQLAHNFSSCTNCDPYISERMPRLVCPGKGDDASVIVAQLEPEPEPEPEPESP